MATSSKTTTRAGGKRSGARSARAASGNRSGARSARAASGNRSGARSARAASGNRSGAKNAGASTGQRQASRSARQSTRQRTSQPKTSAARTSAKVRDRQGPLVKAVLGALAGGAAAGVAGRAAIKRTHRPRVLGVNVPRQLTRPDVDVRKLAKQVDLKKVAKQVADVAEQVEARSEDVRMLSAQAKRLTRRLS